MPLRLSTSMGKRVPVAEDGVLPSRNWRVCVDEDAEEL